MDIKKSPSNRGLKEIGYVLVLLLLVTSLGLLANWKANQASSIEKSKINLNEAISIQTLLDKYKQHLIFLSVNDDAANKLDAPTKAIFAKKEGTELSQLQFRSSYVGVVKAGLFVEEKMEKKAAAHLSYDNIKIESGGLQSGSFSRLTLAGNTFKADKRGLNVFIVDKSGEQIFIYNYDFFAEAAAVSKGKIYYVNQGLVEQLRLTLSAKDYKKLQKKRAEALKTSILLTDESDLVPAKINFQNQTTKSEIRLKGDWTDHLAGENWSFRVKLDKNSTIKGMRKFSLHHPKTRNYAGEWLFHKLLKEAGILSLQYHFVQVTLEIQSPTGPNIKDLGLYAMEEFFDKNLIERSQRKLGVILKIDEDPLWEERAIFNKANLAGSSLGYIKHFNYPEAKILPFSASSIVQDPNLSDQLTVGRSLFKDYITGKKKMSEVFDVSLLAKYNAICNLLGADHALLAHNYRVYYNPVSGLLEPVGFDANAGVKTYYPYVYKNAETDSDYLIAYAKALTEVSQDSYVKKALNFPELDEKIVKLQQYFPDYIWDEKVFFHNQYVIQQLLRPVNSLNVFYKGQTGQQFQLSMENHRKFPIEIIGLKLKDGRIFGKIVEASIVAGRARETLNFTLEKAYERLFVNKKKRKSTFDSKKDLEKIVVQYKIAGTDKIEETSILPWSDEGIDLSTVVLLKKQANANQYPFLVIDEGQRTITCKQGQWQLRKPLIIPKGYTFVVHAGTRIDLQHPDANIISFSPVRMIGNKSAPVEIFSSTNIGGGVVILNTQDTSLVQHCKFTQLSNSGKPGWVISGAVNFYQAPVKIQHCAFTKNRCEDALNIINSYFEMDNALFTDIYADAFDGDFINGKVSNSFFTNIGNDAIDISDSEITIENVVIDAVGDKGLSAGEGSQMMAKNCIIKNSEIAIASKDQSTLVIHHSLVEQNKLAFTAFQKKAAFGAAKITADSVEIINNTYDFLIEEGSSMKWNQEAIETVPEVKERMYGIEFGKKSG